MLLACWFADDSIIYKTIKSQKDCDSLQEDLDAAERWESDWLMTFHPDKEIGMPATLYLCWWFQGFFSRIQDFYLHWLLCC
jgi:hypothetical protein